WVAHASRLLGWASRPIVLPGDGLWRDAIASTRDARRARYRSDWRWGHFSRGRVVNLEARSAPRISFAPRVRNLSRLAPARALFYRVAQMILTSVAARRIRDRHLRSAWHRLAR